MIKEDELNFLDRFCYKLLIGTFILFVIILLDFFSIVNYQELRKKLSTNINILSVVKVFNGEDSALDILDMDDSIQVSADAYDEIVDIKNGKMIVLGNYNAVEVYKIGIVVKIVKESNETYTVTVKGLDGLDYKYAKLKSIDCHLYKLVKSGDILGLPSMSNDKNYFHLYVTRNGKTIDVFS